MLFKLFGYDVLTPEVARFHNSAARIRIPCAPARTSKSSAGAHEIAALGVPGWLHDGKNATPIPYEFRGTKRNIRRSWLVAPDYKTNKEFDYLWSIYHDRISPMSSKRHDFGRTVPYEIEKGSSYSPKQGNMELRINWGKDKDGVPVRWIIEGKSASNPESLQGEEVDDWLSSEAAEHAEEVWARYGATRAGTAIFPTTPKQRGLWLKALIDMAEGAEHTAACNPPLCSPDCPVMELGVEAFEFTPYANPTYDWGRYWQEHAKAESRVEGRILTPKDGHNCFDPATDCRAMRDQPFAEQFGGKWTLNEGRVLPFRWTDEYGPCHVLHEVPSWFHAAKYYVGFDHGFTDPSCVLWAAVGTDGTTLLYREIYEPGMTANQLVARVAETSQRFGERIDMYVPDPQKPEVASFLRQLGLPMATLKSGVIRDRAAGHARIVNALSTDPELGRPKLFVLSDRAGSGYGCPKTISEWKRLRRKPQTSSEFSPTAFDGADHAFDACRYLLSAQISGPANDRWRTDEMIRRQIALNRRLRSTAVRVFDGRAVAV